MDLPFYALPALGATLEGLLVWRLLKRGLLGRYPYFSGFVCYDLVRTLAGVAAAHFWWDWYAWMYWMTEAISLFLRFLIIWEVVRALFLPKSVLRCLAWKILLSVMAFLLPVLLALSWRQAALIHFHYGMVPPIFEQYLSLAQALLLLTVVAVARYYGLPLGRNVRGLVFGFGLYLSLCAMNFASFQVVHGFLPYGQVLSPVTYVGLIAYWLWAFWEYAPSPDQTTMHYDKARWHEQWNHLWMTTTSLMRRRPN